VNFPKSTGYNKKTRKQENKKTRRKQENKKTRKQEENKKKQSIKKLI